MFVEDRHFQKVTVWIKAAGLSRSGEVLGFAAPVLVNARWDRETNLIRNSSGEEAMAKNKISLTKPVGEGDYVFLGDATATADPVALKDAVKLKGVKRVTSVDGFTTNQMGFG